jgi:head-tail adaptor
MDPGELNVRGSIESKAVTKGASGGMVETWTPLAGMPVYARVRHVDGHAIERPVTAGAGGEVSIGRTVIRITVPRRRHGADALRDRHHGLQRQARGELPGAQRVA